MAKRAGKDDARKLAVAAATIARDNKSEGVTILDLRGLSPVTDYFVIATGTSDRQMRTVAQEVIDYGKRTGSRPFGVTGMDSGGWILVDFVDVVVHLFDAPRRSFYDLELIWGEAPKVRWRRSASVKAPRAQK